MEEPEARRARVATRRALGTGPSRWESTDWPRSGTTCACGYLVVEERKGAASERRAHGRNAEAPRIERDRSAEIAPSKI
jgi:hypothetical protein